MAIDASASGTEDCQLMRMGGAGLEVALAPRITPRYVIGAAARAVLHPRKLVSKLQRIVRVRHENRLQAVRLEAAQATGSGLAPLRLQPGEAVRVKSPEAIRATLDGRSRYRGLAYVGAVMDRFCGRTFTVRGRVERFFDERNWKMVKLREVVLLDGVHCLPGPDVAEDWAGCQRTCFLFWKEAWLERVGQPLAARTVEPAV